MFATIRVCLSLLHGLLIVCYRITLSPASEFRWATSPSLFCRVYTFGTRTSHNNVCVSPPLLKLEKVIVAFLSFFFFFLSFFLFLLSEMMPCRVDDIFLCLEELLFRTAFFLLSQAWLPNLTRTLLARESNCECVRRANHLMGDYVTATNQKERWCVRADIS